MELDQEVRAFFTNDEQVEAKRLQLYVSRQSFKDTIDFSFMFFNRKTSSSAKSILVSQSKFVYPKLTIPFNPYIREWPDNSDDDGLNQCIKSCSEPLRN